MSTDRNSTKAKLLDYMKKRHMDTTCASAVLEDFVFDYKAAVFAGECGLTEKGNAIDPPRYLSWLQLGLAFLRSNFTVPIGCRIGLAWFQYIGGPFPVIALAWDGAETPPDVHKASDQMDKVMREFNRLVNWQGLSDLLNEHPPTTPPSSDNVEL